MTLKTHGSTIRNSAFLLVLATVIFLFGCKKQNYCLVDETNSIKVPQAMDLIKAQQELAYTTQNNFKTVQLAKLVKSIDWMGFKEQNTPTLKISYAPLFDSGLIMSPQSAMKRYIVFTKNNNVLNAQIVEIIALNQNFIDSSYVIQLISKIRITKANDIFIPDNYQLKVLEYDLFYRRKLTKQINAAAERTTIPSLVVANHQSSGSGRTNSTCQKWGVYLVTYNEFGYEVDRLLLYTYYSGICVQEATMVILSYDGGGGPGQGEPYDEDFDPNSYIETAEFNSFQQNYRTRMSSEERDIFDNMSLLQQTRYLHNAYKASNLAEQYFPNSLNNGNGDAFRHALFNSLNAKVLGNDLAKRLADAHENNNNQHPLAKQMDLFNNQVGRTLFQNLNSQGLAGNSFRENATLQLLQMITAGSLRIISNLDSNGQPTQNSALINSF